MDKDAYIKRMEAAVVNASKAMEKLRQENTNLKEKIESLEKKLALSRQKTLSGFAEPSFTDTSLSKQSSRKFSRNSDQIDIVPPSKKSRVSDLDATSTTNKDWLPAVSCDSVARPLSVPAPPADSTSDFNCDIGSAVDNALDNMSWDSDSDNQSDGSNEASTAVPDGLHVQDSAHLVLPVAKEGTLEERCEIPSSNLVHSKSSTATLTRSEPTGIGWGKISQLHIRPISSKKKSKHDKKKGSGGCSHEEAARHIMSQLSHETVYSVSRALVVLPAQISADAIYRHVCEFCGTHATQWEYIITEGSFVPVKEYIDLLTTLLLSLSAVSSSETQQMVYQTTLSTLQLRAFSAGSGNLSRQKARMRLAMFGGDMSDSSASNGTVTSNGTTSLDSSAYDKGQNSITDGRLCTTSTESRMPRREKSLLSEMNAMFGDSSSSSESESGGDRGDEFEEDLLTTDEWTPLCDPCSAEDKECNLRYRANSSDIPPVQEQAENERDSDSDDEHLLPLESSGVVVSHLKTCIATAVVLKSTVLSDKLDTLTYFLKKFACLSVNVDVRGCAVGVLCALPELMSRISSFSNCSRFRQCFYLIPAFRAAMFQIRKYKYMKLIETLVPLRSQLVKVAEEYAPHSTKELLQLLNETEVVYCYEHIEHYVQICADVTLETYSPQMNKNTPGQDIRNVLRKWNRESSSIPITSVGDVSLLDEVFLNEITVTTRHEGLWNIIHKASTRCSTESDTKHCISSPDIFAHLGVMNVGSMAQSLCAIYKAWYTMLKRGSETGTPGATPTVYCIDRLISINGMAQSTMEKTETTTSVPYLEIYAVSSLQNHWKSILRNTNGSIEIADVSDIIKNLRFLDGVLQSGLMEYEGRGYEGWMKVLETYVSSATSNCTLSLQAMRYPSASPLDQDIRPIGMDGSDDLVLPIDFVQCTSVSPKVFKDAVLSVNHIMKVAYSELVKQDEDDHLPDCLAQAVLHILTALSVCMFEVVVALYTCSLRGLLRECTSIATAELRLDSQSNVTLRNLHIVASEAIRGLLRIPKPWVGKSRRDVLMDMFTCAECLFNPCRISFSISSTPATKLLNWAWQLLYRQCPAFIINLDARADRWRQCLHQCEQHNLLGIRVSAVDARGHRAPNSLNTLTDSTTTSESIHSEAVGTHWDSTLNAKFDTSCAVNTATPMTPSERACAASHAIVWKCIYNWTQNSCKFKLGGNGVKAMKHMPPICIDYPRQLLKFERNGERDIIDNIHLFSQWQSNKSKYFLVMEDDAEIKSTVNFLSNVCDVIGKLPSDTDICFLGYVKPRNANIKYEHKLLRVNYLWQLHAYLLSPTGARKLLSSMPINAPVDNFIARLLHENKLKGYALPLNERLVKQSLGSLRGRQMQSDIIHSGRM